jgi:hypothetical protein
MLRRVARPGDDDATGDQEVKEDFAVEEEEDEPVAEPDPDELDVEDLEVLVEEDDDDDEVADDEDEDEDDEDDDDTRATTRTKRRAADEEEDEDDDLLSPDDVEADLDRILKDRMVTTEEDGDEEDEEVEPDDRGDTADRLQPKRPDEQLCPSCFLLVRASAPGCPVGDDACPIFN